MFTKSIIPATLLLLISTAAFAQEFDTRTSESDAGARIGASVEKKFLAKRLAVSLGEEVRFYDNFSSLTRSHTSLEAGYKLNKWVKAQAAYIFIADGSGTPDAGWTVRHRFQGGFTGSYSRGMFKISLREMARMTHRTDDINLFQQPRNAWVLRSRLKGSYEILCTPFEPFLSVEMYNALNAVDYDSLNGNVKGSSSNSVVYSDTYVSRLRFQAGTGYYINKKNSMDVYVMYDLNTDKKVDASRYGVPKSYGLEKTGVFTVGVNYNFAWK